MKKIVLSLMMAVFTVAAFSQQKLTPVKIDNLVTVSFPAGYQTKDTLGQHIYTANGQYGYFTVIVAPNAKNNTPLNKENDLNKVFNDYVKKIQAQAGGSAALHARDTTVGTLKAKAFTLKIDDNAGGAQYINFTLIYTQEVTYTFEYVYPSQRAELVKDEYRSFISTIKLSPELQRNDQYISNEKGMAPIAKVGMGAVALAVILLVVIMIVRKKNNLAV